VVAGNNPVQVSYNTDMNLDTALDLLAEDPAAPLDLAELALELARDEYPSLDVEATLAELAALAHELRGRLRGSLAARVAALTRFLFHDLGFHGNERDYYDPRNSYLNDVLDRRTGLPITLSVVAIAVGTRAGLDVAGVGLPGHFIARASLAGETIYFDPFHGGRLLSKQDCEALVEKVLGVPFEATAEVLAPVPVGAIAVRMLTNLKGVHLRQGDHARAARVIARLCQLCPRDAEQRRDLGVALLQAGRAGAAIDALSAYLEGEPPPVDSRAVRELLRQAQGEVARWN
jgi:regulator of sirC expression with transglutaminase-like and TPR domain